MRPNAILQLKNCIGSEWDLNPYIYIYIYIYIYMLTQSFELVSGSIGWGAGLQSSRLAQGKGSNPLKVLIKENKSDLSNV